VETLSRSLTSLLMSIGGQKIYLAELGADMRWLWDRSESTAT
jgi:hypothetical protein